MRQLIRAGILVPALIGASSAMAANWTMRPDESTLELVGKTGAIDQSAAFKAFSVDIEFDPAALDRSSVTVVIDLTSVETGDEQYDGDLKSKNWFFVKNAAEATFSASDFKDLGSGTYEAAGTLDLRGVSVPTVLTFDLQIADGVATMNGQAVLNRFDFGVGAGTDEKWVGAEVRVGVRLVADKAQD